MVRQKLHLGVFFFTFFAISLIEGIHFILDLRFLYFFIFLLPFFLFLLDEKKHYSIPKVFFGLSIFYIGSSFISLLNSKQIGISIELFLRDFSLLLLFFYTYQHAESIKRQLPKIIMALAGIFITTSLICLFTPYGREFIKGVRLNFLFNPIYPHKAIGDYLVFPLLISVYGFFIKRKRVWLVALIFILPIFLLSFSRTAYIALGISLLVFFYYHRKLIKKPSLLLTTSLGMNAFFILGACTLFVTRINNETLTFLQNNRYVLEMVYPRSLLFSRSPYWIMGIKGFLLDPFRGIGQGNFPYLSYRFTDELFISTLTSFNVVVDMLAEQGTFVTFSFIALVVYIVIKSDKKSLPFLLFISLLVSFLGFATYIYTQVWTLFFIVGGLALASGQRAEMLTINKKTVLIAASVGVLYVQLLFIHTIFVRSGQYEVAQLIYPYNRENMEMLIEKKQQAGDSKAIISSYIEQYRAAFSVDALRLEYVGDTYASFGIPYYNRKAIKAYEESFLWGGYIYGDSMVDRIEKLYLLKRESDGVERADKYVAVYLQNYKKLLIKDPKKIQQNTYDSIKKRIELLQEE